MLLHFYIYHFYIYCYFLDDRVAFPSPGSLQLYGLCVADAGTYQCQVSNEGGMATYKCELHVEEGIYKLLYL